MRSCSALIVSVFLLFLGGCDEAFNPDGPYQDRLVVYGVFSAQSDTQFVRVYRTYARPTGVQGSDVPDARVTVAKDDTIFGFHDTTVVQADTLQRVLLKAYVAYGLRPQAGHAYTLSVTSPSVGNATARTRALFRGSLVTQTNPQGDIAVRVTPGVHTRAYIVRMYLDYLLRLDSLTQVRRQIEVPERIFANGLRIYPQPVLAELTSVGFSGGALSTVINELRRQHPGNSIRPLRTVFVLTQMDSALYAYYSTVNHFPNSGTIRLDEPDFTNIEGGRGVFGMISQTTFVADTTGKP